MDRCPQHRAASKRWFASYIHTAIVFRGLLWIKDYQKKKKYEKRQGTLQRYAQTHVAKMGVGKEKIEKRLLDDNCFHRKEKTGASVRPPEGGRQLIMTPIHQLMWDYVEVIKDPRMAIMIFPPLVCFGMELAINNQMAMHYLNHFQMKAEDEAAMASAFGGRSSCARSLGGNISKCLYAEFGFRGRVWAQFLGLFEACNFVFGLVDNTQSWGVNIAQATMQTMHSKFFFEAPLLYSFVLVDSTQPWGGDLRYLIVSSLVVQMGGPNDEYCAQQLKDSHGRNMIFHFGHEQPVGHSLQGLLGVRRRADQVTADHGRPEEEGREEYGDLGHRAEGRGHALGEEGRLQ